MSSNFQIVTLPGKKEFRIATTDSAQSNDLSTIKSPEWMVKVDGLFHSSVEGYNDYVELFGWYGESSRYTNPDVSGPLFTSSTLRHTDLVLIIPYGGYCAQLESNMNLGVGISNLTVVRLGNIGQMKVMMQMLEFKTCKIQSCQQQLDRMILQIMIGQKTNTVYVYGQDGQSQGQMVSHVDYITNSAT
jgi:hypothetical protein